MFIDSHTHLDQSELEPARLIQEASEDGVGLLIQVGINLESSLVSVRLAEEFTSVVACVGFHPQEAGAASPEAMLRLQQLVAHPRVVAVGETGFDFYHDNWPHEIQEEVFIQHLRLAREAGLPVVIHTREAAERTLAVLERHAEGLTVVLHCFSLPQYSEVAADRGYYQSFAGNVTYKTAIDLQQAVTRVPAQLLLLETDAPWLTPVPYRGRPNRPALVVNTYEFVAQLRGVSTEILATQVEKNVKQAFPKLATALAQQEDQGER